MARAEPSGMVTDGDRAALGHPLVVDAATTPHTIRFERVLASVKKFRHPCQDDCRQKGRDDQESQSEMTLGGVSQLVPPRW